MNEDMVQPAGMVILRSAESLADTFAHLDAAVQTRGLTVFASIDFGADAAAIGLSMAPARILIFGNPRAGTPLMLAAPTVVIDLPLKVAVWEDAEGAVWVGYNTAEYIGERHSLPDELLRNLGSVRAIAEAAVAAPS
jgi:uncharacterized protein (DUF302 family)